MSAAVCSTNMKMDLVVRTLHKTLVLSGVDGSSDVSDLKNLLHQRGLQEHIPIPVASKQRLVFKGDVLTSGTLQSTGIRSGDHLVLLLHRPARGHDATPVDTTPVPNAATIRSAISAEARRRGIENTITEEPTRAFRHYGGMPMEVDQHLMQLIQALRGRSVGMEARVGQQRQAGGAAGEAGAGDAGPPPPPQQQQTEAGSGSGRRFPQPPMHLFGGPQGGMLPPGMMLFGMPQQQQQQQRAAAAAAAAPPLAAAGPPPAAAPPPLAIPEPDAQAAAQLGEMGFGEPVVRKALLLHRNDMEAALNWLLQHGEDPAAAEPLTEEQLRQIYSRGPRGPPSEPELVEQLVAMGFDRNRSAAALRRFRNMDMALAYLLRAAEEEGGGAQQQQQPQQQAGAEGAPGGAAAAASPGGQPQARGLEARAEGAGDGSPGGQQQQQQQRAQPSAAGAGHERGSSGGGGGGRWARESEGGENSMGLPELASSADEDEDEDMGPGRHAFLLRRRTREAEGAGAGRGPAGAPGQPDGADAAGQAQSQVMAIDGGEHGDEEHGVEGEMVEDEDMEEDEGEEGEEGEEEGEQDDEEEEEEDEEGEQFAGSGRRAVLHLPLGGGAGGLGLAAAALPGDAFEAPFALYGGAPAGVGATAPALAVTRGPDGNDLVLGSTGAAMPPLMPARGMMLGGMGLGGGGGGGGGGSGSLGPQLMMDLPGLFGGGDGGGGAEDELELQGMGLMQQLLNAVLRDAMGGGEGGAPGGGGGVPGPRR
ncbi:hypothetical protein PLESTB_000929500 [Pleodorina starrii]|uniref:Uncharacterized protein n=1 Tax=Pleodorina starrii TaxID=330485 RepID=A0A9W6BMV6_9CHLO|nr:hypothetical protein PLESTM_001555700 [Pleodorina starrii]GLC54999.1 hypothetical protein PLESTB_000929500 [Pleodorina starrii]GLC68436.1 hypothetical protein PLESTF_000691400 [Pleodorina starrii]